MADLEHRVFIFVEQGQMTKLPDDLGKSVHLKWIRDHLDYPHKDCCLIWPFHTRRAGYAACNNQGKTVSVHRLVCELVHGDPPENYVAAHSCNRGHDGCVNPHHLSWKTIAANQMDRPDGKGRRKRTKLTQADVDQIRAMAGAVERSAIARQFGICMSSVRQILAGETWGDGPRSRTADLTAEQAAAILSLKGKKTQTAIAKEFGVTHGVVWRIHSGLAYQFAIQSLERTKSP